MKNLIMKHVNINKYFAIKEDDIYALINPQTLEGYRSSLEEINKYGLIISFKCPKLPIYDKGGNPIEYADNIDIYEYENSKYPEKDKYGQTIVYL
jgi:hypothetical protein